MNELKKEQSYWDRLDEVMGVIKAFSLAYHAAHAVHVNEVAVKDSTKEIGNLVKRAEIALECAKKLQAEGSSNDSA